MNYLDSYIHASGANPSVKARFGNLLASMPKPSSKGVPYAIEVLKKVQEFFREKNGDFYGPYNFTIQDVIENNLGNCLGLPLTAGTILNERGMNPEFSLMVNPKDEVHKMERKFVEEYSQNMSYDKPELSTEQENLILRCAPLEHLVLRFGNRLMEATSREDFFVGAESRRDITFDEALSCVYKDRAVGELSMGNVEKARELLNQGLRSWKDNREIYKVLSAISADQFDDVGYNEAAKNYLRLKSDDSLSLHNEYLIAGDRSSLERALKEYPSYASAIANKARAMINSDPREARFFYGLASKLVANSHTLDVLDFYIENFRELAELFGKGRILKTLSDHGSEGVGNFDYNMAMHELTSNADYLAEARESIVTPFQKLRWAYTSRGTALENPNEISVMHKEYENSKLYHVATNQLESKKEAVK
jgi:tetratricopeptide (TPR) repeat protein